MTLLQMFGFAPDKHTLIITPFRLQVFSQTSITPKARLFAIQSAMTSLSTMEPQQIQEELQQKQVVPTTPTTFVLFQKLPPELRLRVWSRALSLSGPRTISIRAVGRKYGRRSKKENTGLLAILLACSESHTVALKHHTVIPSQGQALPRLFNAEHDVLRMLDQAAFYEFGGGTEEWPLKSNTSIKHLVLVMGEDECFWKFTLDRFECLTELKKLDN